MRIINIEGIENIGKTTLINKIKEIYPSDKYNVEYVKFPSEDCTGIMNNAFNRIKHYNEYIKSLLSDCDNINDNAIILNNLTTVHGYIGNIRDIYRELSELNVEEQLEWFVKSFKKQSETIKPMTYICDRSLLSTFYTNFIQYELYSLTYHKWNTILELLYRVNLNEEDRSLLIGLNECVKYIMLNEHISSNSYAYYLDIEKFQDLYLREINLYLEYEFSYPKCLFNFNTFVYECINNMRNVLYNFIEDDNNILDSLPILYKKCVNTFILKLHNNELQYIKETLTTEDNKESTTTYKNILDDTKSDVYKINVKNMCNIIDLINNDKFNVLSKYFGKVHTLQIDQANSLDKDKVYTRIDPAILARYLSSKFLLNLKSTDDENDTQDYKCIKQFHNTVLVEKIRMKNSKNKSDIKENEIKEDKSKCCKCGNKCSTCSYNNDHEKVRDAKNENKMETDHTKNSVKTVVRRSMNVRIESED